MVSKFQWKPFWLATQRDPQNDWTATQNRVNYDVFAQASFFCWKTAPSVKEKQLGCFRLFTDWCVRATWVCSGRRESSMHDLHDSLGRAFLFLMQFVWFDHDKSNSDVRNILGDLLLQQNFWKTRNVLKRIDVNWRASYGCFFFFLNCELEASVDFKKSIRFRDSIQKMEHLFYVEKRQ